jgi:hypothetical protein
MPSMIISNSTNSSGSGQQLAYPRDLHPQPVFPNPFANPCVLRVLSVGGKDEAGVVREALKGSPHVSFAHANNYRELWRLSKGSTYDAVVFHSTVSHFELEEAAHLVRHGWPSAKILLIRSGEITLQDPLYDLRLRPPVDPNTLLNVLLGKMRPAIQKPRPHLRVAHAMGG